MERRLNRRKFVSSEIQQHLLTEFALSKSNQVCFYFFPFLFFFFFFNFIKVKDEIKEIRRGERSLFSVVVCTVTSISLYIFPVVGFFRSS